MALLVILLILILAVLLINAVVPGGIQGIPGLIIFVVIVLLCVGGGLYSGDGFGLRGLR